MSKKKDTREGAEPGGTAGADPAIVVLSYEEAMAQLEALVERIEQGEVGLEESLASYRRGEQLLRHLKGLLDRAETTVRELSVAEVERGGDRADRADHF